MLVGRRVDACLEVNAGNIPAVPPVPGNFAGLDPGSVRYARRLSKKVTEVGGGDFSVFPDGEDAPWKCAWR